MCLPISKDSAERSLSSLYAIPQIFLATSCLPAVFLLSLSSFFSTAVLQAVL